MEFRLTRTLIAFAALLLAVATALGAVASHALALDPDALHSFETAVEYQFIHSLGLLAVSMLAERQPGSATLRIAALLLLVGILLFCGGVYASSLDGPQLIASMAPTGGIALIAGWLLVAFGVLRSAFATRPA